jgi:hypothetical protein
MHDQHSGGPVRILTDVEVFAALAALPERFRFEVGRVVALEPDPDLLATMPAPTPFRDEQMARKAHEEALSASVRPRTHWTVMIGTDPHGGGPSFYGRAPRLGDAYASVRGQIAAFTEVLNA